MTVAVGTASPRLDARHTRYRRLARVRYSQQALAYLGTQANRLSSTVAIVFGKLPKYTADKIKSAASLAAIP